MTSIHAASALLSDGWHSNVRFDVSVGRIQSLQLNARAKPGDEQHDIIVPGMPNLHSHAFQRGMAGLTEARGEGQDSFWTWRELMYRFALGMTPDQVEAVATQLYMEMLEAGFTRVGEFHYLHHGPDGTPYANIAEMAERIAASADMTGIRLTLLPVLYAHSSFGGLPPLSEQRRFLCDADSYSKLYDASRIAIKSLPGSAIGVAPHSLRAVTPEQLNSVVTLAGNAPVHIHIAEQLAEVEACIAWSGARPVEWLLDHAAVDGRWCLVHATHMTQLETEALARTGAVAGLCPVTEANLGDGIFQGKAFVAAGGTFGIGSDSNVLIGVDHELRQLEYSQRLRHHARNLLATSDISTGRFLFDTAFTGGARALQGEKTGLSENAVADFVSLKTGDSAHLQRDQILDGWILAGAAKVSCVWVNGKKHVDQGRHIARDEIANRYRKAIQAMLAQ